MLVSVAGKGTETVINAFSGGSSRPARMSSIA